MKHDCCHAQGVAHAAASTARVLRPGETLYVCPMCPGVESPVPGACPHCGMALESAVPVVAEGEDPELRDMRRRFMVSRGADRPAVPVRDGGHGGSGSTRHVVRHWRPGRSCVLATPVVLWCGWPLLVRGCALDREPAAQHVHADRRLAWSSHTSYSVAGDAGAVGTCRTRSGTAATSRSISSPPR